MEPRNRFQGILPACVAWRADILLPTRFLAPIECLKILAQAYSFSLSSIGLYPNPLHWQVQCHVVFKPVKNILPSPHRYVWNKAKPYQLYCWWRHPTPISGMWNYLSHLSIFLSIWFREIAAGGYGGGGGRGEGGRGRLSSAYVSSYFLGSCFGSGNDIA